MSEYSDLFLLLDATDFSATFQQVIHRRPYLRVAYNTLTSEYQSDPVAKAVLDRFANLGEDVRSVPVNELEGCVGALENPRTPIIKSLKKLAASRWGEFITGRKGRESRLQSSYSLRKIGQLAGYRPNEPIEAFEANRDGLILDAPPGDDSEPASAEPTPHAMFARVLDHTFNLRPDYPIHLRLPMDLTQGEANRLAEYLKTLPFA